MGEQELRNHSCTTSDTTDLTYEESSLDKSVSCDASEVNNDHPISEEHHQIVTCYHLTQLIQFLLQHKQASYILKRFFKVTIELLAKDLSEEMQFETKDKELELKNSGLLLHRFVDGDVVRIRVKDERGTNDGNVEKQRYLDFKEYQQELYELLFSRVNFYDKTTKDCTFHPTLKQKLLKRVYKLLLHLSRDTNISQEDLSGSIYRRLKTTLQNMIRTDSDEHPVIQRKLSDIYQVLPYLIDAYQSFILSFEGHRDPQNKLNKQSRSNHHEHLTSYIHNWCLFLKKSNSKIKRDVMELMVNSLEVQGALKKCPKEQVQSQCHEFTLKLMNQWFGKDCVDLMNLSMHHLRMRIPREILEALNNFQLPSSIEISDSCAHYNFNMMEFHPMSKPCDLNNNSIRCNSKYDIHSNKNFEATVTIILEDVQVHLPNVGFSLSTKNSKQETLVDIQVGSNLSDGTKQRRGGLSIKVNWHITYTPGTNSPCLTLGSIKCHMDNIRIHPHRSESNDSTMSSIIENLFVGVVKNCICEEITDVIRHTSLATESQLNSMISSSCM